MRQTVALKLKEVDGKVPDMDQGVFGKKLILDQGFSKSEVLCLSALFNGLFLITFATVDSCRRYWEMVQSAAENSPFAQFWSSCPVKRDERQITVSMRNPHIPGGDISTFLSRHCRVVREPTHILDVNGFWTGKWAVIVHLYQDFASKDRLQHLPQSFSLGNSSGLIYYPGMPQTCRKCGLEEHRMKDCGIFRVAGHETKDCTLRSTCNLCGKTDHMYKDCPEKTLSYASAVALGRQASTSTMAPATSKKKDKKKNKAGAAAAQPPPPCTETVPAPPPTAAASQPPPPPKPVPKVKEAPAESLSLEEFPLLSPAAPAQRKRKEPESPNKDSSRKKAVEAPADTLPAEQELSHYVDQLVSDPEAIALIDAAQTDLLDQILDEAGPPHPDDVDHDGGGATRQER
ncbi:zinc finger CCHC [Pristimantis euphronides]